ncbi:unnamed protein product [Bursaphelenchus okinawaensis]|uniref:Uncharacterized protein n=1 Tax=Bursaphelenchus okinawaensis TaxID=465554 RepID=A0A811K2X0_9BILA|nr:unnamed protein product [Bursaphelenchus okinawaensis]CAG9089456.1 unnamed protein product [Bursaphelenchus okinawaensis]
MKSILLLLVCTWYVRASWFLGCRDFQLVDYVKPKEISATIMMFKDDAKDDPLHDWLFTEIACRYLKMETNKMVGMDVVLFDDQFMWFFMSNRSDVSYRRYDTLPQNNESMFLNESLTNELNLPCQKLVWKIMKISFFMDLTNDTLKNVIYIDDFGHEDYCSPDELVNEFLRIQGKVQGYQPLFGMVLHQVGNSNYSAIPNGTEDVNTLGQCPEEYNVTECVFLGILPGYIFGFDTGNATTTVDKMMPKISELNDGIEWLLRSLANRMTQVTHEYVKRSSDVHVYSFLYNVLYYLAFVMGLMFLIVFWCFTSIFATIAGALFNNYFIEFLMDARSNEERRDYRRAIAQQAQVVQQQNAPVQLQGQAQQNDQVKHGQVQQNGQTQQNDQVQQHQNQQRNESQQTQGPQAVVVMGQGVVEQVESNQVNHQVQEESVKEDEQVKQEQQRDPAQDMKIQQDQQVQEQEEQRKEQQEVKGQEVKAQEQVVKGQEHQVEQKKHESKTE